MKAHSGKQRGFALVLTLGLLALLVLAVFALSALVRVNSQVAAGSVAQMQARQNARLALDVAIGELQRHAGPDDRLTGMAGIAGVPAGAGNPARQWCGVWEAGGGFVTWLASGSDGASPPALNGDSAVALVATGSVGSDATDREHVKARLLPVAGAGGDGRVTLAGRIAYWIGDEGVKLSCSLDEAKAVEFGKKHAINQQFPGVSPESPALMRLVSYEQMNFANATTAQRQGGFHSHGLTHWSVADASLGAGRMNVNSTSVRYWTGVGATLARFDPSAMGGATAAALGADAAGVAGRPFLTIDAFLTALAPRLSARGIDPAAFAATMRPWLCVRSDTFRVRGYGETLNPGDATLVEASVWCEAIVQRTPESAPGGLGRRFVVTSFRWLGPNDL